MGKSFNDDVFNNGLNLGSINGLSISKEAIEENKKESQQEELQTDTIKDMLNTSVSGEEKDIITKMLGNIKTDIDSDDVKEKYEAYKREQEKNKTDDIDKLKQEILAKEKQIQEYQEQHTKEIPRPKDKTIYTKKTMIFKQEYLDIIDGLASINDMQIKDVLNQLLEKAINELDEKVREKAIKESKKNIKTYSEKSIF